MPRLLYDFSRCITAGCPLAASCLRKTPGRPDGQQVMAAFPGDEDCHGYIGEGEA